MKLIIQPGDGVERLVKGIRKAKKSVEVMIFRFDRSEIERALIEAVERGLFVHALIAFTNRGGEEHLRKLEKRFLAGGITVARTAGDLVRYHGKMMIVDRKELYLLSFNFTHLDIDRSRGFGLVTRNPKLVAEAVKLFEADTKRQVYSAGNSKFLVSPVNARKELTRFIKGAKKELLVYDPKISDRAMLRLLNDQQKAGVEIRVLGCVSSKRLSVTELKRLWLHTRTIVRDRTDAFVGSQSLRQLELDARREIGIIFRDNAIVKDVIRTFEEDWAASSPAPAEEERRNVSAKKTVKKIAKLVTRKIAIATLSKKVTRAMGKAAELDVDDKKIERAMKQAVKSVVEETAKNAVKEAVDTVELA
jgi:phosphatidylserine/phosphatidylglycerophosphate/cardiolipin synthase-like enzyme